MQIEEQFASGRTAWLREAATAAVAASLIAASSGAVWAQDVNRATPARAAASAMVQAGPVASAQASAVAAPAASAPVPTAAATVAPVRAPAAAPTLAAARPAAAENATLPAVNVNAEKPRHNPVQRRVQGPNREPIKIPVNASGCRSARAPGKPYFIEFRSRTAVSYGHTFVLHGQLGGGNSFASYRIAGLHPKGDDPNVYLQGMMVPVESETGPSWGDEDEQYLTARFCVTLTEAEYRKALAYIRHLQATKKTWHATTYNCNAFAADIARFIGLDSPNPNMYLPETFIKRMADLNPRNRPATSFGSFGFWGQQQPAAQSAQPRRQPAQRTAQPTARQPAPQAQ